MNNHLRHFFNFTSFVFGILFSSILFIITAAIQPAIGLYGSQLLSPEIELLIPFGGHEGKLDIIVSNVGLGSAVIHGAKVCIGEENIRFPISKRKHLSLAEFNDDGKTILYLKGIRLSVVFTMLMKILMVK